MRFVRCEACGAKALVAASQCPQCGVALELRDSRGNPVPLAHCPECDFYYPRKRGACTWCGTRAPAFRVAPYAWSAAAIIVVVAAAWGLARAWFPSDVARDESAGPKAPHVQALDTPPALPSADTGVATARALPSDTSPPPLAVIAAGEVAVEDSTRDQAAANTPATPAPDAAAPSESPDPPAPPPPAAAVAVAPKPRPAPTAVRPVRPVPPARATPSRTVRWVNVTVRSWIRVRVAPNARARTLVMLGPDTRVQTGDVRGAWVRVRTRGITGWVDRKLLPPRPRAPGAVAR
jgi:hypothetical protein